jgi:hypothetical protein
MPVVRRVWLPSAGGVTRMTVVPGALALEVLVLGPEPVSATVT